MIAELKSIDSLDIDLDSFEPEEPGTFSFFLDAFIGPWNSPGGEHFQIQVCTPQWLLKNHTESDALFGFHLLIVFDYNKKVIAEKIQRYCERCTGESWEEVAQQLCLIGLWEFENYTPNE